MKTDRRDETPFGTIEVNIWAPPGAGNDLDDPIFNDFDDLRDAIEAFVEAWQGQLSEREGVVAWVK